MQKACVLVLKIFCMSPSDTTSSAENDASLVSFSSAPSKPADSDTSAGYIKINAALVF